MSTDAVYGILTASQLALHTTLLLARVAKDSALGSGEALGVLSSAATRLGREDSGVGVDHGQRQRSHVGHGAVHARVSRRKSGGSPRGSLGDESALLSRAERRQRKKSRSRSSRGSLGDDLSLRMNGGAGASHSSDEELSPRSARRASHGRRQSRGLLEVDEEELYKLSPGVMETLREQPEDLARVIALAQQHVQLSAQLHKATATAAPDRVPGDGDLDDPDSWFSAGSAGKSRSAKARRAGTRRRRGAVVTADDVKDSIRSVVRAVRKVGVERAFAAIEELGDVDPDGDLVSDARHRRRRSHGTSSPGGHPSTGHGAVGDARRWGETLQGVLSYCNLVDLRVQNVYSAYDDLASRKRMQRKRQLQREMAERDQARKEQQQFQQQTGPAGQAIAMQRRLRSGETPDEEAVIAALLGEDLTDPNSGRRSSQEKRLRTLDAYHNWLRDEHEQLRQLVGDEEQQNRAESNAAQEVLQRLLNDTQRQERSANRVDSSLRASHAKGVQELEEDHLAHMAEVQALIDEVHAQLDKARAQSSKREREGRKQVRHTETEISEQIELYDEEMTRLSEETEAARALLAAESKRLEELRRAHVEIVQERETYEQEVLLPRRRAEELSRRQHEAAVLIQSTYRSWKANRPKTGKKGSKKGSKKKKTTQRQ